MKLKQQKQLQLKFDECVPSGFMVLFDIVPEEDCYCIEIMDMNFNSVFHKDYHKLLNHSQLLTAVLTDIQPMKEVWESALYKTMSEQEE